MSTSTRRQRGFTIVELLVVVSIIALLLAILLPALGGVQRRARKANELNNLRQVGFAWNSYSTSNNDAALPGYLTTRVQEAWRVAYEMPDGKLHQPAPTYDEAEDNSAGPWTWRLMPYMGYNLELIRDYLNDDEENYLTSCYDDRYNLLSAKALAVAEEPAFGYNGYYVGGYWKMFRIGDNVRARYEFCDVSALTDQNLTVTPVATSIGSIRRSEQMIVFCSSARRTRGIYRRRMADHTIGADLVTPPYLGEIVQWGRPGLVSDGDPGSSNPGSGSGLTTGAGSVYDIEVINNRSRAPLGRYNGLPAILYADGHTDSQTYGALFDQRLWLNDTRKIGNMPESMFQHTKTQFSSAE